MLYDCLQSYSFVFFYIVGSGPSAVSSTFCNFNISLEVKTGASLKLKGCYSSLSPPFPLYLCVCQFGNLWKRCRIVFWVCNSEFFTIEFKLWNFCLSCLYSSELIEFAWYCLVSRDILLNFSVWYNLWNFLCHYLCSNSEIRSIVSMLLFCVFYCLPLFKWNVS